eukprot:1099722_1
MSTPQSPRKSVSFKVSVLGDAQVGKTKLLTKYMQSKLSCINKQFDTTYIETIGVNTMEKTIQLPFLTVHISFWELGGQQESISLLPAVCSDSKVIFFVFDLTQKSSLISIKNWYKKSKREKKNFIPFLIGTKFDLFEGSAFSYRTDITLIARTYAQRMKAPLIYCSSAQSMNIRKLFKLLTRNLLNLKPKMKQKTDDALLEFNPSNCIRTHRKHKTVYLGESNCNWVYKEQAETCVEILDHNPKVFKKRVKRIKSQLDLLKHDPSKLKQIEQILGLSI